jgi:hypothetical protein
MLELFPKIESKMELAPTIAIALPKRKLLLSEGFKKLQKNLKETKGNSKVANISESNILAKNDPITEEIINASSRENLIL